MKSSTGLFEIWEASSQLRGSGSLLEMKRWVEKNLRSSVRRRVFNSMLRTKRDRGAGASLDEVQQEGDPPNPTAGSALGSAGQPGAVSGAGIQERPKRKARDTWPGGREQPGRGSGSSMEEAKLMCVSISSWDGLQRSCKVSTRP